MEAEKIRHSAAHILAAAVKELFPKVKLGIGPAIDEGFYYDFYAETGFTDEDLKKIEGKMKEIIRIDLKFKKFKATKKEAEKILCNEPFKLELLKGLKDNEITFYQNGNFIDLCKGPHVDSTKEVKAIKLLRASGAYWKGDSNNKQMQRIYGVAFSSEKELNEYLKLLEEAEKRDHKKIGKEMELFMISDLVGKGLPIWLPKGEIIKKEVEKFALEMEKKCGYVRVSTPHLAKEELFIKSGHLPHYKESMYPKMAMDDGSYYLKAMNCPMHHLIFNHKLRSYKELPLRIAEYGTVYRNELSGTLSGLLRVRMLSMNDAHIYCTKEQIAEEIELLIKMTLEYYKIFGFKDYYFRLSLWNKGNKEKYINEPENWKTTEEALRQILKKLKVKYTEAMDEAAFYGPKIDIQFKTVLGREETLSTIQLDFAAKGRFDLRYVDKDTKIKNDVFVIHRAPLSTHERFIAFLTEHYVGRFPLWLSPVQVKLLTITDRNIKFANEVKKLLDESRIRCEINDTAETMNKKVRDAELERIPLIVTIGDKETENKTLAIRTLDNKVKFGIKLEDFISKVANCIKNREIKCEI